MGYFSNGTEGMFYEEQYCCNCLHRPRDPEEVDCPIWLAHMLHNYRDCNDKESILHLLIPRTEDDLGNEECKLFMQRPVIRDLFEEDGRPGRRSELKGNAE